MAPTQPSEGSLVGARGPDRPRKFTQEPMTCGCFMSPQLDSPAGTESPVHHSAISFPGTPPFFVGSYEGEEMIATGGFRRKNYTKGAEEIYIVVRVVTIRSPVVACSPEPWS